MNMLFKFLALFPLFFHLATGADCPFDKGTCTCNPYGPNTPNQFSVVTCIGPMPTLSGPKGTYFTERLYIISGDAYKIPASYFAVFSSILTLHLDRNDTSTSVKHQFDPGAFKDTKITTVIFQGIDALLPPPPSLVLLGVNGLEGLRISVHGPTDLIESGFKNFTKLTQLIIDRTQINKIDDKAFVVINQNLKQLELPICNIQVYPMAALSYMPVLSNLNFGGNNINSIPPYALTIFPKLDILHLDSNPLGKDVENGNLDALPSSLTGLYISNIGVSSVPANLLARNPHLVALNLQKNKITGIKASDFPNSTKIKVLFLGQNPIDHIERGAFQNVHTLIYIDLIGLNLTEIDLYLFSGMTSMIVKLDDNQMLTGVELEDVAKMPTRFNASITNTGLAIISSKLENYLKSSEAVLMDVSNNVHLQCKDLTWIAPYVLCTKQITANGTLCADQKNVPLIDYLTQQVKDPCKSTQDTSTVSTWGTTTKGSSSVSSSILTVAIIAIGSLFLATRH